MTCQTIPMPEKLVITDDKNENLKSLQMFILEWNNFYIASQMNKKDEKLQVALLMSALGRQGLMLVESLRLTDEEKKTTSSILKLLEQHLLSELDVPYERFMFNMAKQESDESVYEFVDRLRQLIKTCSYDELQHDDFIRDRLLVGLHDPALRTEFFKKKNITLKEALSMIRIAAQSEVCNPICQDKTGGPSRSSSAASRALVTSRMGSKSTVAPSRPSLAPSKRKLASSRASVTINEPTNQSNATTRSSRISRDNLKKLLLLILILLLIILLYWFVRSKNSKPKSNTNGNNIKKK